MIAEQLHTEFIAKIHFGHTSDFPSLVLVKDHQQEGGGGGETVV